MTTRNDEHGTRNGAAPRGFSFRVPSSAFRVLMLVIVVGIAVPLLACPVCYGAPNDPMVKGTNNGVWVLLGVVGFVQLGFAALFLSFWRRARAQKRFRDSLRVIEGGTH
jgi:hypothetical protein